MATFTVSEFLKNAQLKNILFDSGSFEVLHRPEGDANTVAASYAAGQSVAFKIGNVQKDKKKWQLRVDFTGNVIVKLKDGDDVVFQSVYTLFGIFDINLKPATPEELGRIFSASPELGYSITRQIYPYARSYIRIILTSAGFKGIEPPWDFNEDNIREAAPSTQALLSVVSNKKKKKPRAK